jgi:hypothetical protein
VSEASVDLSDPRFADITSRAEHKVECMEALDEVFGSRTLVEWRDASANEQFPWEPVDGGSVAG